MLKYLLSFALLGLIFSCQKENLAPADGELDLSPKFLVTLIQGPDLGQNTNSGHENCGDITSADRPISNAWINLFISGSEKGEEIESLKTDRFGQVLFTEVTPGQSYDISTLLEDGTEVSETVIAPTTGRKYLELRFQ